MRDVKLYTLAPIFIIKRIILYEFYGIFRPPKDKERILRKALMN